MAQPLRIVGYAIVSIDGMIADRSGQMPDALKIDADQRQFDAALDSVEAVVHGRHSDENQVNSPRRRRLILTRRIAALVPDPQNPNARLWNPAGASFAEACRALGVESGTVAIIGGTEVFGLFLATGYDAFNLSRANRVRLPGGRPVFPQVPARTPDEVLASHGLKPGPEQVLDARVDATLTTWTREAPP
jgi:dihydrofolate reductase